MKRGASIILAALLMAGCATSATKRRAAPTAAAPSPGVAATKPSDPAELAFDEIDRPPLSPATRPTTNAATTAPAPLEAIALFAEARNAMLQGQRYTAINLLEKAIRLDPHSYELRFWLGQAYTSGGLANEHSIAAYEAAAGIDPDHLIVHSELGRQYLAKNESRKALDHLLLAAQTSEYAKDDSAAAVVDFYLGRALQVNGYDRAALEIYQKLIERLEAGGLQVRGNPELAFLVAQPETLFVQVAVLLERRKRYDDAIRLYTLAIDRKPGHFSYQAQLIRALSASGRGAEARRRATEVVRIERASPDSLALLKETFRQSGGGGDDAVARELSRLHRASPKDRSLLYALVDVLASGAKSEEATGLLAEAAQDARYETELVRRLFKLYDNAGDVDAAARLLIEALAARPDNTRDLTPMWSQLLRPWRKNHLTVRSLQGLKVSPQAQAAKLYWVSQLARLWNREALARSSLEQAVRQVPPFPPAYRALVARYWSREDWDAPRKREATEAMASSVEQQGDAALAAELRGLALLNEGDAAKAAEAFARAQKLGNDAPDLRLAYATALASQGETGRAEQVLWKLAKDQPTCEEAYLQLFRGYLNRSQPDAAVRVLQAWLSADPSSVNAHIVEATVLQRASQPDAAERTLNELFASEPDNGDVLEAMAVFYGEAGRVEEFIAKLEAQRTEHPENRTAVEQLVLLYASQKRTADAVRVLDAVRAAAAGDADLLYYIAGLYSRVGQKETMEHVLEQVVQTDPQHAPACNDLGYGWAEQGRNLIRAEAMIRTAVEREPDNHSFLDSLGWVLYKRGRFQPAREALEEAVEAASFPDPVVLDHLGDVLYRLDLRKEAAEQWKRSNDRIAKTPGADDRDDLRQLRLQLQQKLKQSEAGQPVSVSPVVEEPPKQAKN
jgi:tetratricopeptide (TPR) repeat protein